MKATFYARVSTDSDEQKNSIVSQIEYFKKYLEEYKYGKIDSGVFYKRDGKFEVTDGYYVDEGLSGAKSNKYRKAFQQMMREAKLGKFNVIFTKSISRFGRNAKELLIAVDELRALGIAVIFDDLKINTLNRADDFKLAIFAAQAEEESRSKSESVQFGKMQGYRRGVWGGREPFGYDLANGRLVRNEDELRVVKKIFRLYLDESMGVNNIANVLNNDEDCKTKSGKAIWRGDLISKILKNVIYTGELRLHRTMKIDINQNLIKKIPKENQIVLHDENLRIIDDETFMLVQNEKKRRLEEFGNFNYIKTKIADDEGHEVNKQLRNVIRSETRHSTKHIFSNILKCGNCQGSLRRKVQKNKNRTFTYWFCRNNDQFGKVKCEFRNLQNEEDLFTYVKDEIVKYRENKNLHKKNIEMIIKKNYNISGIDEKIAVINETIEDLKEQREANFKLFSKSRINDEEYEERNIRITSEIKDAESEVRRLTTTEEEIAKLKLSYKQFIAFLHSSDLDNLSNASLRKIVSKIYVTTTKIKETNKFVQIEFDPDSIQIDWNFIGNSEGDIWLDYSEQIL